MKIAVDNYWNVLSATRRLSPDAVISIMDAADLAPDLSLASERHLRMGFHDISKPERNKILPTQDQINCIVEFAEHHRKSGAKLLLVHCREDPARAAIQLFKAAPFARPNMLMVQYADELYGWKGTLGVSLRKAKEICCQSDRFSPFVI